MTETSGPPPAIAPRSVPQLLDRALALYLGRSSPMFALSLGGGVLSWLLLVLTGHTVTTAVPPILRTLVLSQGADGYAPAWWASLLSTLIQVLVWGSLLVLAAWAALHPAAEAPVGEALRAGLSRLWPLLVTTLAMVVLGGLAAVLLILPGVFLLTRWTVAPVEAVVERRRASTALGRSFALVRGLFWHTLGAIALGSLAVAVATAVLGAAGLLLAGLAGRVGFSLRELWAIAVSSAVHPYLACLLVLLYYDLRARREGLDLEGGS